MITVYTYLCFSIFGYYDPDKKKRCLRKQNVLMFVMHLTAFLVMYLEKKDTKILALYLMQVTLLGGTILLYSFIYGGHFAVYNNLPAGVAAGCK